LAPPAIGARLLSNSELKPHTPGGCDQCLGALTIDGNKVTRNPSYYIIAHASKFVRPDSKRIASNTLDELANVAFENTDGDIVLIVLNNSESKQTFNLNLNDEMIKTTLAAGAVGTYLWEK
jgi:glucosylceramidase